MKNSFFLTRPPSEPFHDPLFWIILLFNIAFSLCEYYEDKMPRKEELMASMLKIPEC